MTLTRRTLLGSLFCAAAAPAIVRISSPMPVKAMWMPLSDALALAGPGDTIWIGRDGRVTVTHHTAGRVTWLA
jgi:hypothetical protein